MKNVVSKIILVLISVLFVSCNETRIIYDGKPYIAFSDTLYIVPATSDGMSTEIPVASLSACDYDRTYFIESLAGESNAVEGYHYNIDSHTITIPAGETVVHMKVTPVYENIEDLDSLGFSLRLVSEYDDVFNEEKSLAKVRLKKVCPFVPENFVGYCRVYSNFLNIYTGDILRDITCVLDENDENVFIFKDFYDDGYDLRVRVDNSDILNPVLELPEDQCIADIRHFMQKPHGSNEMMATEIAGTVNDIDFCKKMANLYLYYYVEDIGYIGGFQNIIRWLDEGEI